MPSTRRGDTSCFLKPLLLAAVRRITVRPRAGIQVSLLAGLAVLMLSTALWSQDPYDVGGEQLHQRAHEQFDRITETLQRYGKILMKVGIVLLGIVVLKIINPINLYYNAGDRALRRAVRNVDDLLKKIREDAEAASADAEREPEEEEEDPFEGGLLAGMTEIVEMSNAEDVPPYVLTVNDLCLDDVRITLKRLHRFRDGSADRYKISMFSVITGIKMITEQSMAAGIGSGLAVNINEYFADERRCRAWKKTLAPYARRGEYQEQAQDFLMFMKNLTSGMPSGTPTAAPQPETIPLEPIRIASIEDSASDIPDLVNEETLPKIQQAAIEEARNLCRQVRRDQQLDGDQAWQFALVSRQQEAHLRKENQRMLMVFLNCERKALQKITKSKMLPCRTWEHVLHMLGTQTGDQLRERIDSRFLTVQEIALLEKAFLQTFAKQASLQRIYGSGQSGRVMIDLHIPQIRQEALLCLRRLHQTEPTQLDKATEGLNQEETPQQNEVKRLIQHYVHQRHTPPGLSKSDT